MFSFTDAQADQVHDDTIVANVEAMQREVLIVSVTSSYVYVTSSYWSSAQCRGNAEGGPHCQCHVIMFSCHIILLGVVHNVEAMQREAPIYHES